jgi:hypothetical protein
LSIPDAVEIYSALGFDFIALTDHDHLLREHCYDGTLSGLKHDLLIFKGVELTVFEKGYLHLGKIEGDREILHIFNHPAQLNLPLRKVIMRIERLAKRYPVDAVEVTDMGFYTPEYDIEEIPYPKVATDDSHNAEGCGRAWIELECKRDRDSIIKAIKNGDFWNCFNT